MKNQFRLLLAVACVAFGVTLASAQNQGVNRGGDTTKVAVPEKLNVYAMASELIRYGYEQQEALPLIQAAQLLKTIVPGDLDVTKTTEGTAGTDTKTASAISYDVNQVLADAQELAADNEAYLAIINDIKSDQNRGAVGGAKYTEECVLAHDTDVYRIRFRGGQSACVYVSGDGDTDLDLYVYDENGNLIGSDTDYTDECIVTWNPIWTGPFTIKIKNRGSVRNYYSIATN